MKRGIVSPSYDLTETTAYRYGPGMPSGGTPTQYLSPGGAEVGDVVKAVGDHWLVLNPWNVRPGVRNVTGFVYYPAFVGAGEITDSFVEVWRDDGATMTLIRSESVGVTGVGTWSKQTFALTGFTVTLEAGYQYYYGIRLIKATAGTLPYVGKTAATDYAVANKRFYFHGGQWNGATLPDADVATQLNVISDNTLVLMEIRYTSDQYMEQYIDTNTVGKHVVAYAPTDNYLIRMDALLIANTNAVTISHLDVLNTGAESLLDTTEIDMGDTVPGQNDAIHAGATVNLAAIGATPQAGKPLDMYFTLRPGGPSTNLFFRSRELERQVHSHANKNNAAADGSRGQVYAKSCPRVISITGTCTISRIEVGSKPMILVGDSQIYSATGYPVSTKWRQMLNDDLAKLRSYVSCGIAGGTLAEMDTLVFNNATPGDGDLVDWTDMGCIVFFAGMGINDMVSGVKTKAADAMAACNTIVERVINICEPFLLGDGMIVLVGMPPYSAVAADTYEAMAARWINRSLLGLGLTWQCPFYNPWPDMVEVGTGNEDIPTFNSTYSDDGLHYNSAGHDVVTPKVAMAIEQGTIDLRDAWD